MISSKIHNFLHGPFSEIQCDKFRPQSAPHSWVTAPWPWSTSGLRCVVFESRSTSSEKEHINMWSKKSIRLKNKVSWQTSDETEIDRDMWQKYNVLERRCRMETSFLISLTLLSNNNNWPPRKFHNQLRVILTHTPTIPIHNGRNYHELKPRREENANNQQRDSDWKTAREKEEEPWRKRMLFQRVATNSRPNSLSVEIDSDITRICAGRWNPLQSRVWERNRKSGGGVGGENKRVRGPVSEWERERASELEKRRVKTGRMKEIERHHGAQESPVLRKGERQRKKYGERESEGNWNRNNRDTGRKKEEETESTLWYVLHT